LTGTATTAYGEECSRGGRMAKSGRGLVVPCSSGRRDGGRWWWWGGEAKKFGGNRSRGRGGNGGAVVGWAVDLGWVHERGMNTVGFDRARARVARWAGGGVGWGARSGMRARDMPCVPPLKWPWTISVSSHTRFGLHRAGEHCLLKLFSRCSKKKTLVLIKAV